jgi:hypothetical protein
MKNLFAIAALFLLLVNHACGQVDSVNTKSFGLTAADQNVVLSLKFDPGKKSILLKIRNHGQKRVLLMDPVSTIGYTFFGPTSDTSALPMSLVLNYGYEDPILRHNPNVGLIALEPKDYLEILMAENISPSLNFDLAICNIGCLEGEFASTWIVENPMEANLFLQKATSLSVQLSVDPKSIERKGIGGNLHANVTSVKVIKAVIQIKEQMINPIDDAILKNWKADPEK